jgi:hypothetical protein
MQFPEIKMSLEHMRIDIVQAFTKYIDDLKGKVDHVVADVISKFDYEAEVRVIAEAALREKVRDIIRSAFWRMQEDDLKEKLAALLISELGRILSEQKKA